jgi:hypothetical protein
MALAQLFVRCQAPMFEQDQKAHRKPERHGVFEETSACNTMTESRSAALPHLLNRDPHGDPNPDR